MQINGVGANVANQGILNEGKGAVQQITPYTQVASTGALAPMVNDTLEINGVQKKASEVVENYSEKVKEAAKSFDENASVKGLKVEDKNALKNKKGLAKAGEAIKESVGKLGGFIKGHKVASAIVGAVIAAVAAFGIYKGVQAHNNKVEAHQA